MQQLRYLLTKLRQILPLSLLMLAVCGCQTNRLTSEKYLKHTKEETILTARYYSNPWCRTTISMNYGRQENLLQESKVSEINKNELKKEYVFHIRIENLKQSVSPLHYISGSLPEYQAIYSYLLNDAKNDFFLQNGTEVMYPSLYWFTNNYNAFPMDEIMLVFKNVNRKKNAVLRLFYVDKVFQKDTLVYQANNINLLKEQKIFIKKT